MKNNIIQISFFFAKNMATWRDSKSCNKADQNQNFVKLNLRREGELLHVWFISKYLLSLKSCYLRNEAITLCQKVIELRSTAVGQLLYKIYICYCPITKKIWQIFSSFSNFLWNIFPEALAEGNIQRKL